MRSLETIRHDLIRIGWRAMLALFLIPLLTLLFTWHVQRETDQSALASTARALASSEASDAKRRETLEFLTATPPSAVCGVADPDYAAYRAYVCDTGSTLWHLHWASRLAKLTMAVALALTLTILGLGWLAFRGRSAQYRSLVLGWRLLACGSALMVLVQGAFVVWLSFGVPAFLFHVYSGKLIAAFGLIAGIGVVTALVKIFTPVHAEMTILGEQISQAQAPALWARVRALAEQVGSAAPQHIVAGIDANFFVTEGGMTVQEHALAGRTLYVSLPLLRVLNQREADAVLAHELAHLQGGDTSNGAALGPVLARFDTYCEAMRTGGLTLVTYFLMLLYRVLFEAAMMRTSREREFLADSTAARCVAALPLVRALIKVAAYGSYRGRIEQELFAHHEGHDRSIGIASRVAQGLQPFAHSQEFLALMAAASVPHPFDSHPRLSERMANVKHVIPETEFGMLVSEAVDSSWSSDIPDGEDIEQRLWAIYEGHFAEVHEHDLAYRYVPSTDAERELVARHFPPLDFTFAQGKQLTVTYAGLDLPDEKTPLGWSEVSQIDYEDGFSGDMLKLTLKQQGLLGARTLKVQLPGIRPQRDALKAALGQYWHRHQVALGQA